jgi:hypothetical protein
MSSMVVTGTINSHSSLTARLAHMTAYHCRIIGIDASCPFGS